MTLTLSLALPQLGPSPAASCPSSDPNPTPHQAHCTTGDTSKRDAQPLFDHTLPARHRLFLSATPRLLGGEGELASMDDAALYGPVTRRPQTCPYPAPSTPTPTPTPTPTLTPTLTPTRTLTLTLPPTLPPTLTLAPTLTPTPQPQPQP